MSAEEFSDPIGFRGSKHVVRRMKDRGLTLSAIKCATGLSVGEIQLALGMVQGLMPSPPAIEIRNKPVKLTKKERRLELMRKASEIRSKMAKLRLEPGSAIVAMAAHVIGVSVEDIVGQDRRTPLVHYRHLTMCLVVDALPSYSLPTTGRLFSRDHTTIMNALKNRDKLVEKYPDIWAALWRGLKDVRRFSSRPTLIDASDEEAVTN